MALPDAVRARLLARGIDPEQSCDAWLAAIRDGSYDLTRLRRALYEPPPRLRPVVPVVIPLAVVLPDEQKQVPEAKQSGVSDAESDER